MVYYVAYVSLGVSFILCVVSIINKLDFTLMSINISITQGLLFYATKRKTNDRGIRNKHTHFGSYILSVVIFERSSYFRGIQLKHYPDSSGCNLLPRKGTQCIAVFYWLIITNCPLLRMYRLNVSLITDWDLIIDIVTHHAISKLTCYIRVTAVALLGDMPDMDGHWLMPRRAGTGPLLSWPCRHPANSRPVLVHLGSP